ncbi:MAG: DNA-3-methyladenine glycosylase I [Myxococcota bacterium]|jgi:DNA-3-methyladenine glycosylase I|nr:DNA-3-methyladenine glycosylase I [Myxococcota bacterium]
MKSGDPSLNLPKGLARSDDGFVRCWWCGEHEDYRHYHDHEWGRPVHDDTRLFEKICLEGFQSGLSWLTILRKREGFREAFHGFDFERVARMTKRDVDRLVENAAIVRHRQKIESTIHNAKRARELAEEHGSLDAYFWKFVPPTSERPTRMIHEELARLGKTETSIRLSKDLKKRGWSFVGPTTVYAFMQAMGLVNDHLEGCHVQAF